MSRRASKKTAGDARGRVDTRAFYVYCIGERAQLAPLFEENPPAPIETATSLEAVTGGELSAVVSPVSLADYGEEVLQERLADATWTATRALRHQRAVEFFARRTSVIPLRFGTIYLTRERIEQLLEERRAEFQVIIERLRGSDEWGVNVYVDRAKLKDEVASVSSRLRELAERAASVPPGQAYLLRKKIDAMRADEARVEVKRVATEVETELAAASVAPAVRLRLLKDEATEHGELVAKLAFLVRREDFDKFRESAERLAERYAAPGFGLELTGPWPAYNFADRREAEEKR